MREELGGPFLTEEENAKYREDIEHQRKLYGDPSPKNEVIKPKSVRADQNDSESKIMDKESKKISRAQKQRRRRQNKSRLQKAQKLVQEIKDKMAEDSPKSSSLSKYEESK